MNRQNAPPRELAAPRYMRSLQTTLTSSQLLGMADMGIEIPDLAIQVEHYL
jgi:hypothetical protein